MNVLPFLEILALLLPPLAFAETWSIPREYRRPIKATSRDDTVAFSFRSGGHVAPDGQDVVVADEEGKIVPSEVILSKRLGDTWVTYQASAAKGTAFVYYGGKKPAGPAPRKWQPKLSLMLVTVPLPDGALESYAPIASATDSMSRAYGLGFVPSVFHGFNPFGPSDQYASKYSGYLIIPKDGKYRIFTFSDEASFVLLDGKSVCAWPGRHDSSGGARGEKGADIQLKQGEHRIEYYHAEVDGGQSTGLGWVTPGSRYCLIPESAFVHTPVVAVGPPERQDGVPMAAFEWQRIDLVAHDKFLFARVRFTSQCQNMPANGKVVWDYGDGIKSTGMAGDHIYVAEGPFECEARILDEHGKALDEFKLLIPPDPSMGNLTILNTKQVEEYLQVIGTYDLSKRPKEELEAYWALAQPQELPYLIRPITEAYVDRFGHKGAGWAAADRLAQAYSFKEPEKAVDLYEKLASSAPTKPDAVRLKAEQLDILINRLKRHKVAMEMLKQMQKSRDELTVQLAGSKLGDIPRSQGDFEKAAEAYRDAQEKAYKDMDPREIAVREGGYLETVDGYLGSGNLRAAREMLLNWEAEYPTGKLRGDLILMTARYFQAIGDHQRALDELTTLTKLNPLSPYLPEIEWRMARAYAELGNKAKARELRDRVIREYPKSRAAAEAEKEHF
jgi:TolA-binding protein